MRHSRIFTRQVLEGVASVTLQGPQAHYLARVLRAKPGTPVTLFNGDGRDHAGVVQDLRKRELVIRLVGSRVVENESPLDITLVQAISRGERMDQSLQKVTELGVRRIQPLLTRRVEIKLAGDKLAGRLDHWRKVVISACEQCGRAVVPEVQGVMSLHEWLAGNDAGRVQRLVLDPQAELKLSGCRLDGDAVAVLVGPEGGFDPEELQALQVSGAQAVSLGPRVLRTETAGPIACAVLQSMAGDL